MAEQISHNVVENSESTSAQSLVDVPATTTTFASADAGINERPLETKPAPTSQLANDHATDSNALTSTLAPGLSPTDHVADPSAGDATSEVAPAPAAVLDNNFNEKPSPDAQLVNGTHTFPHAADGNVEDAHSVDVSVNSDTEGSRGDASEVKQDEKHHTRTNSVKKPATFSKVAVTKNFMAKSATAAPVIAAKTGDKPSPVGTPPQSLAARPRLIAKTGASLRDVQKARLSSDGVGGPDASKVWNKNRRKSNRTNRTDMPAYNTSAAVPQPPRQFTDEELKQQYGIHLATRLQTDENGKDSKWADIDDDEDDWAPETVVWMDGTKSTLTPHDTMPAPLEQKPTSPSPSKPAEDVKPPAVAVRKPTELGPTKTILKPGANAAAAQARQNGSSPGALVDKSSLKAKSPAPAPAKSPWASIPPVEKMSPINPPVQQQVQPPPFATQDARAYEQQLPPPPAREIAADTFDRSWREGEGVKRELFNSSNGRYEPVTEGRRSSIKPDSSVRNPAVLQRPTGGAGGPAEPSAAFQTRSTTQTDGPWARRRGSSVSQGSLPPGRRMSITNGPEMSPVSDRRSSTVVGRDMRSSPQVARAEPAQPMFSPQSAWQAQMPPRPEEPPTEPAVPEENPVQVQERIMREKRELAIKRRKEDEERQEAEKQQRLKARLAQLEGAGKSRKEREAEAAAAAAPRATETPTSERPPEIARVASMTEDTKRHPANPAEVAATVAPALEGQTLPTAPEDARAQQLSPEEVLPSPLPPKPQPQQPAGLPDRTNTSADPSQRQQQRHLSPRGNPRAPFAPQSAAYRTSASPYSSAGDRKPQTAAFDRSPLPNTGAFSPWPTAPPNSNVWGTSSGIGNGTFETTSVFAPMPITQQNSSLPPPPGMTRPTSARISPQSLAQESRSPNLQQQQLQEAPRGYGPPGFESRPDPFANQARTNGTSPAAVPGLGRPTHPPGPIAPPSRAQNQQQQVSQQNPQAARWINASHTLPAQYSAEAEAAERKRHEAAPVVPRDETIKETFKMTSANQGRLGAPRKFDKTEYTVHDAQGSRSVQSLSPAPPNAQTQPSGPFSTASPLQHDKWKQAGENTVRIPDGSLNPAHGGTATPQPPIAPPSFQQSAMTSNQPQNQYTTAPIAITASTKDQSPPPPETSSHPVNSGDVSHPLVKLPPGRPVVKLPPAPAQQSQQYMRPPNAMMMPQRPISNIGAPPSARPIAGTDVWQARFNGLFNRTPIQTETPPSPPKTPPKMQGPALVVTSSSRGNMDETSALTGATVSLPQAKTTYAGLGLAADDSGDVVSKPTIEHMFTEELSFGSKPRISVPKKAAYHDGVYQGIPQTMMGLNTGALALNEGQSKTIFQMFDYHPRRNDTVFVSLPTVKPIRRLLYKHPRKPSGMHQDRKPSGKFLRGKAKEAEVRSSVPAGPLTASSRKPSGQNGHPPAAASDSADAVDGNKRGGSKRGLRKPQASQAPQASQTVKST